METVIGSYHSFVAVGRGGGSVVEGCVRVAVEVVVGVKSICRSWCECISWSRGISWSRVSVLVGVIVASRLLKVGKRVGMIGSGVFVMIGSAVKVAVAEIRPLEWVRSYASR